MLVVCQFPVADARPFLNTETYRLPVPAFPVPVPGHDFLRSTGMVKARRRGGIDPWPGEGVYCDAQRAVRFGSPPRTWRLSRQAGSLRVDCKFRRYVSGGDGSDRIDVGFATLDEARGIGPLDGEGCLDLIGALMTCGVLVPGPDGKLERRLLVDAGPALAALVLRSTTSRQKAPQVFRPEGWWIASGTPLFIVEYLVADEIRSFPGHSRRAIRLEEQLQQQGIELAYCQCTHEDVPVAVWFLGGQHDTDPDVLRRLRIHLSRVHALRESLRQILRLVVQQRILVVPGTQGTEALQDYLNDAFHMINRQTFHGFQQARLLEAAYAYDRLVNEGDRATLLFLLAKIRGNILRKVSSGTENPSSSPVVYQFHSGSRAYLTGGGNVDERQVTVNTGGGAITGSPVGFENVVRDSFNTINGSDAAVELKDLLKELVKAVSDMCVKLPGKTTVDQAARDVQSFTAEVVSPSPRKSMLATLADSLTTIAKTVGQVGEPVIRLTSAILKLTGHAPV